MALHPTIALYLRDTDTSPYVPAPVKQPIIMSPSLSAAAAARKDSLASLATHLESMRLEGEQRLIIVSNRLPVTIKKDPATGEYGYKMSSGGLVSALSGCKKTMNFTWIGWPGQDVSVVVAFFFLLKFWPISPFPGGCLLIRKFGVHRSHSRTEQR